MLNFLISFIVFIAAVPVQAGFFDDDEKGKNCYNWYGEKEVCYRQHQNKKESYIGFNYMNFYGSRDESMTGSVGTGATYLTTSSLEAFRFIFGGSIYYSDSNIYLSNTGYSGTLYSAEVLIGFSLKAYRRSMVRPMLEVLGVGGLKSLQLARPPDGVDTRTVGFSYGVKGSMGMEFGFWRSVALRAMVDYYDVRADIAGVSAFPISSFGGSIGLTFFH